MKLPSPLTSLILLSIPQEVLVSAIIPPRFEQLLAVLGKRQCAVPCGYNNAYCCGAASVCYTDAQTRAQCAASTVYASMTNAVGGAGQVYTTTYVETDLNTITSTYTIWNAAATTSSTYLAQSTAICTNGLTPCGAICCSSGQVCWASGDCRVASTYSVWTSTSAGKTSTYSAAVRPTTVTTSTTNVVVTTTQSFETPVGTAGGTYGITSTNSSNGLSGGAIAGIVIGTIAGIILLLLICFCCCLKAGFDTILGIFGLGRKNRSRERTEVIEERYSRYGSRAGTGVAASRRETHGGWFGGEKPPRRERKSNEGKWVAGGALSLAALWALLGFRRKQAEKRRTQQSVASYSSYTESYTGTSDSE